MVAQSEVRAGHGCERTVDIVEVLWGAGKGTRTQETEVGVDAYYTMKTRQEGAKEEMAGALAVAERRDDGRVMPVGSSDPRPRGPC